MQVKNCSVKTFERNANRSSLFYLIRRYITDNVPSHKRVGQGTVKFLTRIKFLIREYCKGAKHWTHHM